MRSIIKDIFELKNEAGFTTNEITESEKRLNIKLPNLFKEFYRTYAKHPILNNDFGFEQPMNFYLDHSKWIVFYGGSSGVYWWAINKENLNKKDLSVYINFDGHGYKKEARNFEAFLMLRIFEHGHLVFPFRMHSEILNEIQVNRFYKFSKNFKSRIENKHYLNRGMFWNNPDEIFCIIKLRSNKFSLSLFSKKENSIEKHQELFPNIKWKILPNRTTNLDR